MGVKASVDMGGQGTTDSSAPLGSDRARTVTGVLLALLTVAVTLTALAASQSRHPSFSAGRVAFWWGASMLLVVLLATWRDAVTGNRIVWSLPRRQVLLVWTGMTVLAAAPRLVMLDRFPTVLDADEGAFIGHAVEFQNGQLPNPFGTGFFSTPLLYLDVQGILAGHAMDGIGEYRLLSAILGTIGVVATWRLGRRIVGPTAGLLAGILLAGWPLHLYFSRSALNNITDSTFLIIALLFVLGSLETGRALDAMAAGLALAGGFYGYYGGRVMWMVVLASLVTLVVFERHLLRSAVRSTIWMTIAFVVATMPLLMWFRDNPAEFGGHLDSLGGAATTGINAWVHRVPEALVYPVAGNGQGFLRHDPPYIGWPLTVLVSFGIIAVAARSVIRRDGRPVAMLLVPYVLLCAGIALTDPLMSQRFSAVMPILAITAGAGLAWIAGLAGGIMRLGSRSAGFVIAVTLAVMIGIGNVRWLASEDRQLEAYGDTRTTMMWDIGWRLREGGEGTTHLLVVGAPYVYANGFANLNLLAPDVVREDVVSQIGNGGNAPDLATGTILVLAHERVQERCSVEAAYPNAVVGEGRDRYGNLLYVSISDGSPQGWSASDTPAGTTWAEVPDTGCDGVAKTGSLGKPSAP